ncbi:hypothetical protein NIES3974_38410 [Calothrix sp. NIES-3974]|nr:hypothetical protein NIES3974_38410 [Calothrix sp. NIES-3974]
MTVETTRRVISTMDFGFSIQPTDKSENCEYSGLSQQTQLPIIGITYRMQGIINPVIYTIKKILVSANTRFYLMFTFSISSYIFDPLTV